MAATAADVLDALSDPTRRSIVERLSAGPLAVGKLADQLPVSRPTVSQHLRVLRRAELVTETVAGTRHLYRLHRSGLALVRDYFDQLWETTLDSFVLLAEAEAQRDPEPDPGPEVQTS